MKKLKEGKTEFWVSDEVFYNPVMKLARDLSILVTSAYQRKYKKIEVKFGDVLAATGLRGLRIAKEVKNTEVLINDRNPEAFRLIKKNIKLNKLTNAKAFNQDANIFVLANRPFDVIDVDPFGSFVPFLNSAVRSLYKNGLLCVTATDTPVPIGLYPQTCYRRYGVRNFKTVYSKELGLRILLSHLARTAAEYDFYLNPLIAHSTAHYFRIYCTVAHGAQQADQMLSNLGYLLHCPQCGYRKLTESIRKQCPLCKTKLRVMRDLWIGKVWDPEFCESVLKENEWYGFKINKLLSLLVKDSQSPPLYYDIHKVCKKLKTNPPKTSDLLNKLKGQGYHVSRTHFGEGHCIKTNAPVTKLKECLS